MQMSGEDIVNTMPSQYGQEVPPISSQVLPIPAVPQRTPPREPDIPGTVPVAQPEMVLSTAAPTTQTYNVVPNWDVQAELLNTAGADKATNNQPSWLGDFARAMALQATMFSDALTFDVFKFTEGLAKEFGPEYLAYVKENGWVKGERLLLDLMGPSALLKAPKTAKKVVDAFKLNLEALNVLGTKLPSTAKVLGELAAGKNIPGAALGVAQAAGKQLFKESPKDVKEKQIDVEFQRSREEHRRRLMKSKAPGAVPTTAAPGASPTVTAQLGIPDVPMTDAEAKVALEYIKANTPAGSLGPPKTIEDVKALDKKLRENGSAGITETIAGIKAGPAKTEAVPTGPARIPGFTDSQMQGMKQTQDGRWVDTNTGRLYNAKGGYEGSAEPDVAKFSSITAGKIKEATGIDILDPKGTDFQAEVLLRFRRGNPFFSLLNPEHKMLYDQQMAQTMKNYDQAYAHAKEMHDAALKMFVTANSPYTLTKDQIRVTPGGGVMVGETQTAEGAVTTIPTNTTGGRAVINNPKVSAHAGGEYGTVVTKSGPGGGAQVLPPAGAPTDIQLKKNEKAKELVKVGEESVLEQYVPVVQDMLRTLKDKDMNHNEQLRLRAQILSEKPKLDHADILEVLRTYQDKYPEDNRYYDTAQYHIGETTKLIMEGHDPRQAARYVVKKYKPREGVKPKQVLPTKPAPKK